MLGSSISLYWDLLDSAFPEREIKIIPLITQSETSPVSNLCRSCTCPGYKLNHLVSNSCLGKLALLSYIILIQQFPASRYSLEEAFTLAKSQIILPNHTLVNTVTLGRNWVFLVSLERKVM